MTGESDTPRDADTRDTDADAALQPGGLGVELEPGALVGEYRIEKKLGHGGMGTVYEAVHAVIEKKAALKVMRPELSRDEEAVARFVNEAKAVNRIRHPSIVDVFGFGTTQDGRCFLVMELLDGESLAARLQYDPPGIAEACDILIAITHALDAAHMTDIVHRDLKPDNVFLVEGKHVKLLDFGIAKLLASDNPSDYTQPGQAMGTPRYISPEQARGQGIDARSDIYSLGVMAFELLTGKLPFTGRNAMELITQHVAETPPTPTDIAPTLPPSADSLLLQMLDKEPSKRPPLAVVRATLDDIRAPWVTTITPPSARPKPSISELLTVAKPRKETPADGVTLLGTPSTKPGIAPPPVKAAPKPRVQTPAPVETSSSRWQLVLAVAVMIAAGIATFLVVRS